MTKQITSMLNQVLELSITLLRNLLSSHVDHFRDNSIINSGVSLILLLSDFLGNIYSFEVKKVNFSNGKFY